MHPFVLRGIGQAVQLAMRSVLNAAVDWLKSFFRRRMVCVWIMGKEIPQYTGNLKDSPHLFLKNSAYKSLQVFFSEKPLGATVFWTAKGAGKTYTLARVGHASNHRFVYIDWKDITGRDAKTMFYNQLKMNAKKEDKPFGTYLPDDQGIFTTFVFDHFDYAMIDPDKNARALIAVLSENSTQSSIPYNILIMVNNPLHARDLLLLHGWDCHSMFVKLMGPPYCGHWFSKDLGEMSDERYNALIDQCGTLMPMISIRNGLYASDDIVHLMRATTSKEAWDNGERILAQFRYLEV